MITTYHLKLIGSFEFHYVHLYGWKYLPDKQKAWLWHTIWRIEKQVLYLLISCDFFLVGDTLWDILIQYFDGLVQDCSNSSTLAMELLYCSLALSHRFDVLGLIMFNKFSPDTERYKWLEFLSNDREKTLKYTAYIYNLSGGVVI